MRLEQEAVSVEVLAPDGTRATVPLSRWEEADGEVVGLAMPWQDTTLTLRSSDFWEALRELRQVLERNGTLLCCYGTSRNVYPSPMMRQMGAGDQAYKLELRRPARQGDIVDIFATGPDLHPATVAAQEAFCEEWLKTLVSGKSGRLMVTRRAPLRACGAGVGPRSPWAGGPWARS